MVLSLPPPDNPKAQVVRSHIRFLVYMRGFRTLLFSCFMVMEVMNILAMDVIVHNLIMDMNVCMRDLILIFMIMEVMGIIMIMPVVMLYALMRMKMAMLLSYYQPYTKGHQWQTYPDVPRRNLSGKGRREEKSDKWSGCKQCTSSGRAQCPQGSDYQKKRKAVSNTANTHGTNHTLPGW